MSHAGLILGLPELEVERVDRNNPPLVRNRQVNHRKKRYKSKEYGGPRRVNRGFEKHRFEPMLALEQWRCV
jgi:hypothetical protein